MLSASISNVGRTATPSVLARRVAIAAESSGDDREGFFRSLKARKIAKPMHQLSYQKVALATKPEMDEKLRDLQQVRPLFGRSQFLHEQRTYDPAHRCFVPNVIRNRTAPPEDLRLHDLENSFSPRFGRSQFVHESHVYDPSYRAFIPVVNANRTAPTNSWDSLESYIDRFDQSAVVLETHTYGSANFYSMKKMCRQKQYTECNGAPRYDQLGFEHQKHTYGSTKFFNARKMTFMDSDNSLMETIPIWAGTELYETRSQKQTCKV